MIDMADLSLQNKNTIPVLYYYLHKNTKHLWTATTAVPFAAAQSKICLLMKMSWDYLQNDTDTLVSL